MNAAIAVAEKTLNSKSTQQMEPPKSEKSAKNGEDFSVRQLLLTVVTFLASISRRIWT